MAPDKAVQEGPMVGGSVHVNDISMRRPDLSVASELKF